MVILDFWATWCGPCIQSMPIVEKTAGEFPEKDVILVAVNVQETPPQIKDMLDRHQLKISRVALDREGTIAEKYQANAYPQTVIIGREGNISRLFVGGGSNLDEQLRDAIKATLSGEKPEAPKKEAGSVSASRGMKRDVARRKAGGRSPCPQSHRGNRCPRRHQHAAGLGPRAALPDDGRAV